jgi:oligopeptidase B
MIPPAAKKIPQDVGAHGNGRTDDFYWLRDRDNPDVTAYLEQENEYTRRTMEPTKARQERLYTELLGRIRETDSSAPQKFGDYFYYSRTEQDRQYSIHCRKKLSLDAVEEILLDENERAAGHNYYSVGVFRVSPDHRLLAWSEDTSGSESHTIYVKNLETGALFGETIPNTSYGVEWAEDNKTLFYNTLDEAVRPYRLHRHRLGQPVESDELVYHEKDPAFHLELSRTKSRRFLLMTLESNTATEVRYLESDDPGGEFRPVEKRRREVEYSVAHNGDWFYIVTNDDAKNFKLVRAPVADPGRHNWKQVIAHRKHIKIDEIEVFERHVVVYERRNGLKKIRILDLEKRKSYYVPFADPTYTLWSGSNPEYKSAVLRYHYTSLVCPQSVYDFDMDTSEQVLQKRYDVLGGYDPALYKSERIYAPCRDGTRIPVSLVYRRGIRRDGGNPVFLYGYGAYGHSVDPHFLSHRLSLLDRGFIYAIAHVRGGGEMGRYWYEQGKLRRKKNSFSDFIACAQHLVNRKYTSRGNITIYGGSAGGLLVGAAVNARPGLFRCVVAHVPFVDVVTTMLDETLPLTVTEYEEWGDPNRPGDYRYMLSYSPYDNLKPQDYPHMLVTAGLNDPRVSYWEPAKWVARLRTVKTDDNLLLLKTKMGEGHSGASGRYDYLRDAAFEYAFILRCHGIDS